MYSVHAAAGAAASAPGQKASSVRCMLRRSVLREAALKVLSSAVGACLGLGLGGRVGLGGGRGGV